MIPTLNLFPCQIRTLVEVDGVRPHRDVELCGSCQSTAATQDMVAITPYFIKIPVDEYVKISVLLNEYEYLEIIKVGQVFDKA